MNKITLSVVSLAAGAVGLAAGDAIAAAPMGGSLIGFHGPVFPPTHLPGPSPFPTGGPVHRPILGVTVNPGPRPINGVVITPQP